MSEFDPKLVAKALLRRARIGTLATLGPDGAPYASLVSIATDLDGVPVTLISDLALHTGNLARDARASLLVATIGAGDPLAHPRLSVAVVAERSAGERPRHRFLARHPGAAGYADFPDFSFRRLVPTGAHLVAGFGRIVDLCAADLLTELGDADELVAAEAGAVAHMNEDHADALLLYATRLLGEGRGDWTVSGLDPEGLDLACGDRTARLPFPRRVTSPGALRGILKELADAARAVPAAAAP
ncbi:HugZ family pyridoxamine 5'-phosphate oxidase [Chelatococcus reniformis]|uniref:Pyridoxamine 5'-phosphate oxidase n=1 Tax=Chelatococcus reniformis TaxID=1494448 RepID=A0A916TY63_9HYPH|nr:DUF2470 domain-containing protein [Chelatococcus reniformis]GGC52109.1 pyridoxamine 5'-phosphate oxidase [Chelatococcus reniformis]